MAYMTISKRTHAMARQADDEVHGLDAALQEDGGHKGEDAENHVAGEHVAVKSDGKGKPTQHERDELEEPR